MLKLNKLERLYYTLLAVGFMATYVVVLGVYLTNIPLTDDIYDALYFGVVFQRAQHLTDSLGLLFFQYDEYKMVFNKVIYAMCLLFQSQINFVVISMIGVGLLSVLSALLYQLFPSELRSLALGVVVILCVFNLSHYMSVFWPMSALNNYGSFILAALCLTLLHRRSLFMFLSGCLVLFVLVLSMGNGLFMIPLILLLLYWAEPERTKWLKLTAALVASIVALVIFFSAFSTHSHHLQISPTDTIGFSNLVLMAKGFLILLGSIPFLDTDSAAVPMVLGIFILIALGVRLVKINSRSLLVNYLPVLLFLVFCFISLALCAIFRVSQEGIPAAFNSRYKFIVDLIWAITIGMWLPWLAGWRRHAVVALLAAVMLTVNWRSLDSIRYWQVEKENDITRWVLQGNQASLGLSAWFNFSHEILSAAVFNHVYNPFSSRAVLFQPRSFNQVNSCPAVTEGLPGLATGAKHNEQAVGAKIAFIDRERNIEWVAFCSADRAFLAKLAVHAWSDDGVGKKKMILDSRWFVPGDYRVVFLDAHQQPVAVGRQPLSILPWKPVLNCDESQMDYMPPNKVMVRNICSSM